MRSVLHPKSKFVKVSIAFALLLAPIAQDTSATEYHVATTGSDGNAGTPLSPFRTIQKAAAVMIAGDTCWIRAGVYPEQVTPANSGLPGNPIQFKAYSNEVVTISGADPVTGWTQDSGSIYRATVGWNLNKNNQVFFNGTMVNEARWPNDSDGDIMTPNGAPIEGGSNPGSIYSSWFPASAAADSWNGAVLWVMAQNKWSSWTAAVTSYNPATKRVAVTPYSSQWVVDWHNPSAGGTFYITGSRYALDSAGEWYFNTNASLMYLWAPGGVDPNNHAVLVKRRLLAFDFKHKSDIHLIGVNIMGATINLQNATNCLVQGCSLNYFYHSRAGDSQSSLPGESPGIYVSGRNNTVRDSTIAYGAADGLNLEGSGHAVINCLIRNIDYIGCYGTPVRLWGFGFLISHNTIEHTGRDGLQFAGAEHEIAFNRIREMGRMCSDLGAMYQGGNDGGNTHIHHNWVHDNRAAAHACGIYPDNYSYNYIIYRNIAWNTADSALRINGPSSFNLVYHNTLVGPTATWTWNINSAAGSLVVNNIAASWNLGAGTTYAHNNTGLDGLTAANATNFIPTTALDNGLFIPGISDGFTGAAPDRGAKESGGAPWIAGHDFSNPPYPAHVRRFVPYQNQLRDACFEYSRFDARFGFGQPLAYWSRTEAMQATVAFSQGFVEHPNTRNSVYGNSVTLQGGVDDGVEQVVGELLPGTLYRLRARMKRGSAAEVRFGAREFGGSDTHCAVTATSWTDATTTFRTGPTNTFAIVYVKKLGSGTAYADDLGVAMEFQPALALVDAGLNRTVAGPAATVIGSLNLGGTTLTNVHWSAVSGPGVPTFDPPDSLASTVTFPTNGVYELQLDVSSELQSGRDHVYLTVTESLPPPPFASTGLVLWLDAADPNGDGAWPADGTAVGLWTDKSGGGHHATQAAGLRPTFRTNVLQRLPGIRFDGTDDRMTTPSIRPAAGSLHAFVVSAGPSASGELWQRLLSAYDGIATDDYLPTGWAMLRPQSSGTPAVYAGAVHSLSYASGRSIPTIVLGDNAKSNNQHLRADLCEVLVFDRELAGNDLASVTNYLQAKWIHPPPPVVQLRGLDFSSTAVEITATGTNTWTPLVWTSTNLMMPDWRVVSNQLWAYSGGVYRLTVELGPGRQEFYRLTATGPQ